MSNNSANDFYVTFEADYFSHIPKSTPARKSGLIFFQGGDVDATAYSGYGAALAPSGFITAYIMHEARPPCLGFPLPSDTRDKIEVILADFPQVERWLLAGHSRGSTLIDIYLRSGDINPKVVAFSFLAGYTFDNDGWDDPLPDRLIAGLILGDMDAVVTVENLYLGAHLYPNETDFTCIAGGNHGQFGWYGVQAGDNVGAGVIPAEIQHATVTFEFNEMLNSIETGGLLVKAAKSSDITPDLDACLNQFADL